LFELLFLYVPRVFTIIHIYIKEERNWKEREMMVDACVSE